MNTFLQFCPILSFIGNILVVLMFIVYFVFELLGIREDESSKMPLLILIIGDLVFVIFIISGASSVYMGITEWREGIGRAILYIVLGLPCSVAFLFALTFEIKESLTVKKLIPED